MLAECQQRRWSSDRWRKIIPRSGRSLSNVWWFIVASCQSSRNSWMLVALHYSEACSVTEYRLSVDIASYWGDFFQPRAAALADRCAARGNTTVIVTCSSFSCCVHCRQSLERPKNVVNNLLISREPYAYRPSHIVLNAQCWVHVRIVIVSKRQTGAGNSESGQCVLSKSSALSLAWHFCTTCSSTAAWTGAYVYCWQQM